MALSFCHDTLSARHYSRSTFTDLLEMSGTIAVHFISPGPTLDCILKTISELKIVNKEHLNERGISLGKGQLAHSLIF